VRGSFGRWSSWGGEGIGTAPGRFLPGGNARQGDGGSQTGCEAEKHFRVVLPYSVGVGRWIMPCLGGRLIGGGESVSGLPEPQSEPRDARAVYASWN